MIKKRHLSFILAIVLCFTTMLITAPITAFAEGEKTTVAKVDDTEYETIDEAIAKWTNGTTLTLLKDVTLGDTIKIKSTEHHILNLSTYTMTSADGKNAIEILPYGTGNEERNALTINADNTNPGGIDAGKKSCIYYKYTTTYTTGNDRPIIKINNGVFTGGTSAFGTSVGIYAMGVTSEQRKCATLTINGGTFNCAIYLPTMGKMLINGGTFNYAVGGQGGTTAFRLISGGKFKSFSFLTADSDPNKFAIGSSKGKNDYYIYIDSDKYICVYNQSKIANLPEEDFVKQVGLTAKVLGAETKRNSCLQYTGAKTQGLYYVDSALAFSDYDSATSTNKDIVFYDGANIPELSVKNNFEVDLTSNELLPTRQVILTKPSSTFAFTCAKDQKPAVTVTSALPVYEVVETEMATLEQESNKVTYLYSLNKLPVFAKIGSTEYPSLLSAVQAATAGQTITLLDNVTEAGFVLDKDIIIDLGGNTYTIEETVGSAGTQTCGLQLLKGVNVTIKNGTITSSTAKMLVQNYANLTLENVTLDGTNLKGAMPYTLSNNCGNVTIKDSEIIAAVNGVAFDVCDYASYTAPIVNVENSTITGKIEMTDCNGGEYAGKLVDGSNTYTALGNYLQINNSILPIYDYNISLNVSNNAIQANDDVTVEVVIDKEYYSLDYTFTYDKDNFSCEQDEDNDGVIEVKCMTKGNAGVLETYTLKALNNLSSVTTAKVSVSGNVVQHAIQALTDIENVVNGETEQIKISLDCTIETWADYVTGYTLVVVKGEDAGYAYKEENKEQKNMFYVTEYQGYAILVEGAVTLDEINDNLIKATDCEVIDKSYDVNAEYVADGKIDLKDATSVYACMNLDFNVNDYMELFLRADVNNDYCVKYLDINDITANYTA